MTTLIQQIEEMRVRMKQVASNECDVVRSLGEALSVADQELLQAVRLVAAEHEMRRGAIVKELELLASRIGKFTPYSAELSTAVDVAVRNLQLYKSSGAVHQATSSIRENNDQLLELAHATH